MYGFGVTPDQYYDLSLSDLSDVYNGYIDKVKRENSRDRELHEALRRAAFITVLPYSEKGLTFESFCDSFWPLAGDPEPKIFDPVLETETYEAIMKAHNLKIQKGRRDGKSA
jgi:hypothetical protein